MSEPGHWFERDPNWFKHAVFYEVHIRGFFDANDDGSGDLRGLTDKLDYLQWLGIDCIWLLPFYRARCATAATTSPTSSGSSPTTAPSTTSSLVEEAHQRGMRVIADLVMNHTSSDHPWFQASRARPEPVRRLVRVGRRRLTLERGPGDLPRHRAVELELDPLRGQYFWHRFFPTSPTSTTTTPRSQTPCSTSCGSGSTSASTGSGSTPCPTSSSATAPTARTCRRPTRSCGASGRRSTPSYPDRVLLAEANQWPDDVVDYFGDGDECHMASTSRSCPACSWRCGASTRMPLIEILAHTPPIPDGCQWGLFLRNHDELTLEMVTDEERDYMYTEYANDPRMQLQPRHPPPARAAPRQRPRRDRAVARAALLAPRVPRPLLRRRDRDGRQHLPRRPRRRPHADAVDRRPQRRLLGRRLRAALPAAADGSRVRLPGGERRGAAADADVVPALAAPPDRAAQGAPGVRARHLRMLRPRTRGSSRTSAATRTTSCSASTTSRARRRRSSSTCRGSRG